MKTLILTVVALASPLGAFANPFTLDTGVDAAGNQLASYATEQRYTVSGNASTATVYPSGTWPLQGGTWVSNVPGGGQWITPSNGEAYGITTYSISFRSAIAQNVSLKYTGDNPARLLLNGNVLSTEAGFPVPTNSNNWTDYGTWGYWTPYTLSLSANTQYTVSFDVYNGGGPAGLIVDSGAISTSVPDGGSTVVILGAGLSGLALLRRKLKTA